MLRARVVVPFFAFAVSAMTAIVPLATTAAADSAAVSIHDGGDISTWGYGPSTETVSVGDVVTFTNTGASPHDATSADGSWNTPLLQSGQSASVTFSTPGTFAFTCVLHPWMKGTIVVAPAASAPAVAPTTPDVSSANNTAVNAPAPAPAPVDVAPPTNPAQTDVAPAQPSDTSDPGD
jgi:plastocyanin